MATTRVEVRGPAVDVAIGERVTRRLTALGMTQWDLAARLGLTQATVSRKLHGVRPWFAAELVTVAGVLGMSVGELFGERCGPAVVIGRPAVASRLGSQAR